MVTTAQTIPTRAFFRKCCSVPFSCSGYFCLTVSIFPAVIPEHLSHPEPSVVSHFPLSHFPLTGSPCIQLKWQFNEKFHLDGMCCFSNLSAVSEATGRGLHSSSTAFISQHNHGPLCTDAFLRRTSHLFLFPCRSRSRSTPTIWSTGWRTSTRQATIRCSSARRRSFAELRRVKSVHWSLRPPVLWYWSS